MAPLRVRQPANRSRPRQCTKTRGRRSACPSPLSRERGRDLTQWRPQLPRPHLAHLIEHVRFSRQPDHYIMLGFLCLQLALRALPGPIHNGGRTNRSKWMRAAASESSARTTKTRDRRRPTLALSFVRPLRGREPQPPSPSYSWLREPTTAFLRPRDWRANRRCRRRPRDSELPLQRSKHVGPAALIAGPIQGVSAPGGRGVGLNRAWDPAV
jgi:hypothetical protein